MDRIDFHCPFCERPMHAPAAAEGKTGRCKSCRQNVVVRRPQPEEKSQGAAAPRPPITPRWIRTPAAIAGLLLLAGIGYNVATMTRTETWTADDELSMYVDRYSRWSNVIQHREVTQHTETLEPISRATGPMSASGQPHGKWKISLYGSSYLEKTQFYWYGDEVSEGEWETRSK